MIDVEVVRDGGGRNWSRHVARFAVRPEDDVGRDHGSSARDRPGVEVVHSVTPGACGLPFHLARLIPLGVACEEDIEAVPKQDTVRGTIKDAMTARATGGLDPAGRDDDQPGDQDSAGSQKIAEDLGYVLAHQARTAGHVGGDRREVALQSTPPQRPP